MYEVAINNYLQKQKKKNLKFLQRWVLFFLIYVDVKYIRIKMKFTIS